MGSWAVFGMALIWPMEAYCIAFCYLAIMHECSFVTTGASHEPLCSLLLSMYKGDHPQPRHAPQSRGQRTLEKEPLWADVT